VDLWRHEDERDSARAHGCVSHSQRQEARVADSPARDAPAPGDNQDASATPGRHLHLCLSGLSRVAKRALTSRAFGLLSTSSGCAICGDVMSGLEVAASIAALAEALQAPPVPTISDC